MTFQEKKEKIVRITQALSSSSQFSELVKFEPEIPQVNMVHCYLRLGLEECNQIRDQVQDKLGVSIFQRIQSLNENDPAYPKGFRWKFEVYVGEANGSVPDDVWIEAWTTFCRLHFSS